MNFFKIQGNRYALVSYYFRILIGIIYLSVFLSLLFQVKELMSSMGILPISEFVKNNQGLGINFPTIHLLFNDDLLLYLFLII